MGARKASRARVARKRLLGVAIGIAALIALPSLALAHIERASYWPDPAPDTSISPPAGGAVPDVRSLYTALDPSPPGVDPPSDTRVVCEQPLTVEQKQQLEQQEQQGGVLGGQGGGGQGADRAEVDRLQAKLDAIRKARKHATGKRKKKLSKKQRRIAELLAQAKQAYQDALPAQGSAPQDGGSQTESPVITDNPSIKRLDASIADARANGYRFRPSEDPRSLSAEEATKLRDFNVQLLGACQYDSIQAAVNDSGNNDRVVVMPGVYDEPASRAAPTNDPKCDGLEEQNDRGQTGALSYKYQVECPNDQNLIAVIGRAPGDTDPPQPPAWDRHGIPDNGPCIRCNLQIEGSGVTADDVVVDAGNVAAGNGAPPNPVKDIGIRVERADGFVLRNITARHAAEHGIYVVETDGFRLERFKAFYNEEYGLLTFTADHSLIQDCEAVGAGDAGLYPGSAADTGEQIDPSFYLEGKRFSTELRRCDMHHNMLGYSGTDGNAVWVHDNDFYDNSLGMVTDVITAAGHPGYPQDSDLIEHNEFYSNNFNPYVDQPADSEVVPTLPIPVGTAMWILGGNNNEFRQNYVYDNWRRGVMLSTVQDSLVCGDNPVAGGNMQQGCNPNAPPELASTSYRNRFHDNVMGRSPDGEVLPNGNGNPLQGRTDFWWDQWLGSNTNCWHDNVGKDGTAGSLTSTPPAPLLPSGCDPLASTGTGGAFGQDAEVYHCFGVYLANGEDVSGEGSVPQDLACDWFTTPPKPTP